MGRDGKPTRDKILSESKALVFEHGFSGTSIDQILEKAGITKGAFFYHFKTKSALAKALVEEYAKDDMSHLEQALKETEHLKNEPLKRLLAFIQKFIEMMESLEDPPTCLYASYTHESSQFDKEVLEVISNTLLKWEHTFIDMLNEVLSERKARVKVDIQSLANQFAVISEGAFIISKALNDPSLTANQLRHFKQYIALLFEDV